MLLLDGGEKTCSRWPSQAGQQSLPLAPWLLIFRELGFELDLFL